jgi:hypothetical protein
LGCWEIQLVLRKKGTHKSLWISHMPNNLLLWCRFTFSRLAHSPWGNRETLFTTHKNTVHWSWSLLSCEKIWRLVFFFSSKTAQDTGIFHDTPHCTHSGFWLDGATGRPRTMCGYDMCFPCMTRFPKRTLAKGWLLISSPMGKTTYYCRPSLPWWWFSLGRNDCGARHFFFVLSRLEDWRCAASVEIFARKRANDLSSYA